MTWRDSAKCRGISPDFFFPFASDEVRVAEAKSFCADCSVRSECLDFAITTRQEHGVWGGASEKDRRRILRNRTTRGLVRS